MSDECALLTLDPDGYILSSSLGFARLGRFSAEDIAGCHLSQLYPPETASDAPARALAAAIAAADGTYRESGWWIRADGTRFWADTVITATRDATAQPAGFSVTIRDTTRHRRSMARLNAVAGVNQSILDGSSSDEVLTLIARRVREAVGADVARVLALDGRDALTVRAADDAEGPRAAPVPGSRPTPEESALAREAMATGRPKVFSADGDSETASGDGGSEMSSGQERAGLAAVMDIPLTVGGRPVGVIQVARRARRSRRAPPARGVQPAYGTHRDHRHRYRFTHDDLLTVGLFTGPASWAVQQTRAQQDLRRLARTAVAVGQDTVQHPLQYTLDLLTSTVVACTGSLTATICLTEPGTATPSPGPLRTRRGRPALRVVASTPPSRGAATATRLPLLHDGQKLGELRCYYPAEPRPGGSEIALLATIACGAAAAVHADRQRTAAQEEAVRQAVRQAVKDERRRLSRDLHDSVSQALYGIAMGARTARELLDRDADGAAQPIDYVRHLADVGLAEIRAVLSRLSPDVLETEGLVGALAEPMDALRAQYGIVAEARLGAEPAATPQVKHALYRIAQEALHNVVKHAAARHVVLRLLADAGTVTLTVTDDGVGFDARDAFPGHYGLRSMRERALELGGTFSLDTHPGQGTHIHATLPLTPAVSAA